jgi:hypothetical protein
MGCLVLFLMGFVISRIVFVSVQNLGRGCCVVEGNNIRQMPSLQAGRIC